MSPIRVIILGVGTGTCSLAGKECDGLTVTFDDGTVKEAFLGWKSFRQLLALKSSQTAKPADPKTTAPGNGPLAGASK